MAVCELSRAPTLNWPARYNQNDPKDNGTTGEESRDQLVDGPLRHTSAEKRHLKKSAILQDHFMPELVVCLCYTGLPHIGRSPLKSFMHLMQVVLALVQH